MISVAIKEMNKLNDDIFKCDCYSLKGIHLTFDQAGIVKPIYEAYDRIDNMSLGFEIVPNNKS